MRRVGNNIIIYEADAPYGAMNEDAIRAIMNWVKEHPHTMLKMDVALEYQGEEHEVTANIMGIDESRYIIIDKNPFDREYVHYVYRMSYMDTCLVNFNYSPEMAENGSLLNIDTSYDKIWCIYCPIGESGFNKTFRGQLENM